MSAVALAVLLLSGCATFQTAQPASRAEVGVAFGKEGELASFAEGVADPQFGRRVTIDDPARIASVSKLVVAVGVMKLVEAGKLDLDRDVSDYLGWRLRNPAFPDQAVTLATLLSHTGSVREHDDNYVIPLGATLEESMQDLREWDSTHGPADTYFAYTNMNFPIVASVIEKVTGKRFDVWMRKNVLEPMALDACYNWPTCSDAAVARAVELDAPDGNALKDDLHGQRPACPVYVATDSPCDLAAWRPGENGSLFAPQGGLRISARGLARIGRMLLNDGMLDGVRILSPQSVAAMLTPRWRYDGHNGSRGGESATICAYGLSAQQIPNHRPGCPDDPGTQGAILVGHAGDAYGLRSGLWIDRARGLGIAYFVTAVPEDPPEASEFSPAETAAFRRTYALLPR
jgi:CubicO group peptidase (beta-lactamase class C family)